MARGGNTKSQLVKSLSMFRSALGRKKFMSPDEAERNGFVSIKKLAEEFGVSETTARTDVRRLLKENLADVVSVRLKSGPSKWYRIRD